MTLNISLNDEWLVRESLLKTNVFNFGL
jgi:hypothetical protein